MNHYLQSRNAWQPLAFRDYAVQAMDEVETNYTEKLWAEMFRDIAGQEQADHGTMNVQYSEKEGVKNGRAREETRGAFLQRATGEGYAIHEGKTACVYGYRRVDRKSAGKNAGQIQSEAFRDYDAVKTAWETLGRNKPTVAEWK